MNQSLVTHHHPAATVMDRQYAVYVFRERGKEKTAFHLSWQRESLSPTLEAAFTRAALAHEQDGVKRVQVYEILTDESGLSRVGRIVKTLGRSKGISFWKKLRKDAQ